MAYDKANRERLGRVEYDINRILDRATKDGNRGLTSAERTEFHSLETDHTKLAARIAANESATGGPRVSEIPIEEMQDRFRASRHDRQQQTPYERVFSKYLRTSEAGLDADEMALLRTEGRFQNTTSTTSTSEGGALVPRGFSQQLERAMKWFGGVDGLVESFFTETGNPVDWPLNDDSANVGRIISQNVQVTQTDPTFTSVTFNSYIFSSDSVLIPLALAQDSFFDLDQLLASMLGERIGRLLNQKCTTGSGSSEPTGIVVAATAAGNVVTFPGGETATITYNDLVNIEHSVDPAYRYNAGTRWMFSDGMLKIIKKLVDSANRPLWQPGLSASFAEGAAPQLMAGSRPTILDHPFVLNSDMAAPAANAYSVLFGDLSRYKLRKVGSIQVARLRERFMDYLQIGYIAWLRCDGQLLTPSSTTSLSPIALGRQAAA